ncbi:MAG: hypothetical protein HYV41_00670 [Candidatus Magasanikbacteria bacterium]|nr:hypothetical protein [Candidatus Magasanikbacteria bacterium]
MTEPIQLNIVRFEQFIRKNLSVINTFLDYLMKEVISVPTNEEFINNCLNSFKRNKHFFENKIYESDTNELCFLGSQIFLQEINRLLPRTDQWIINSESTNRIIRAEKLIKDLTIALYCEHGPKVPTDGRNAELRPINPEGTKK